MSKTPFRETPVYPVVFMLIISIIFVGVLALMFRSSEARIEANQSNSYQQLILQLFADEIGKTVGETPLNLLAGYPETFNSYIKEIKFPGVDRRVYSATAKDSLLGYCFDIGGKGLWGSMRALIALNPDLKTMKGIVVYEQMETPGLGARISESWFSDQFKNLSVKDLVTGKFPVLELIPEGKKAENPRQIMQVTGATITTNSVVKMLNDEINYIFSASSEVQP